MIVDLVQRRFIAVVGIWRALFRSSMGVGLGGFVGRRAWRTFLRRGFLFVLTVFLREEGIAFADAGSATTDAGRVEEHVLGTSFSRRRPREVGPGTGVKVFKFRKLESVFVEGRVFDLPDGIVQLAVEFDQQFELFFVELAFATRQRVTLGRKNVTALIGDDVGIISAC